MLCCVINVIRPTEDGSPEAAFESDIDLGLRLRPSRMPDGATERPGYEIKKSNFLSNFQLNDIFEGFTIVLNVAFSIPQILETAEISNTQTFQNRSIDIIMDRYYNANLTDWLFINSYLCTF